MQLTNVNPTKLMDDFTQRGVHVYITVSDDNIVNLTVLDNVDMDLVQQIIDAHDPTPIPPPPTQQDIFEQQITANTDYLLDIDFRLILVELGMF